MENVVSIDKADLIDRIYSVKMILQSMILDVKEVRENFEMSELANDAEESLSMLYELAVGPPEDVEELG